MRISKSLENSKKILEVYPSLYIWGYSFMKVLFVVKASQDNGIHHQIIREFKDRRARLYVG